MNINFYTVTDEDGVQYAGVCPHYQWDKVAEYFGVPKERITRGARANLPFWNKGVNSDVRKGFCKDCKS